MSRIIKGGRDWTAPTYRSPWQDERATRFEPTSASRFAELYRAEREPLWKSIAAGVLVAVPIIILVVW